MRLKTTLYCSIAALGIAGLAELPMDGISSAHARPAKSADRFGPSRVEGTPLLAIVSLREQHVTIYDATGKILQSPVSTGATGLETPAGIYSIVQKEVDHHSNIYDDASMPHMERITWTGMALHAGVLPGYPASHGCIRMPHAFAGQLYELTELGLRVVVVREDIAPLEIEQPAMFTAPERTAEAAGNAAINVSARLFETEMSLQLQSIASARSAEAEKAVRREKEAKLLATKKSQETAPAVWALRAAEANFARVEADLKASEHAVEAATTPEQTAKAEAAKTQASARLDKARAEREKAKQQAQAKQDAAAQAEADAKAASLALNSAVEAAQTAKLNTSPVSVFISRKTQRLYIRKGNYPIFEGPVTIRDADKPIGTFVFTSLSYTATPGTMRWNVVSMYKNAVNIEPYVPVKRVAVYTKIKQAPADPGPADAAGARAALERLEISQEAVHRISEILLPGSSLIISDEGPSNEIGKDTDFIVFMSGDPQGGIAIRQRNTASRRDRRFGSDGFGRSWRGEQGWRSRDWDRGGGFFWD